MGIVGNEEADDEAKKAAEGLTCYETSIFISFLDYWQVTLIWSPYGDASLIRSLFIDDTSTITILTWLLESR